MDEDMELTFIAVIQVQGFASSPWLCAADLAIVVPSMSQLQLYSELYVVASKEPETQQEKRL